MYNVTCLLVFSPDICCSLFSFFSFYFKLTALSIVVGLVDISVVIAFVSCFIYLKVISMTEEEEEDDENTATNTNEHPENLEGGGLEMVVSHNFMNPLKKNDKSKRVQNNALFMQEAPPQPVKRPGSKKRTKSSPTQAEQLRKKSTKSMEARRNNKKGDPCNSDTAYTNPMKRLRKTSKS